MNIFVGNLSFDTTEDQLQDLFAAFGEVKSAKIVTDNYTGRSRGFGFVEMVNKADGETAVEKLNNTTFLNRSIAVNEARPKNSDSRGGGGGFNKKYNNSRY